MSIKTTSYNTNYKNDFVYGLKRGLPIFLGYIPVSFTFGLMAVEGGMLAWLAILISFTNLTSAGQFVGLSIILQNGSLIELGVTTLIINLRYMLMSLSLSQKVEEDTSLIQRAVMSFGITDEIFAVASIEPNKLSFSYMCGLIILPLFGWTLGTALGALISDVLSARVQNAMGIALYAMFIALVIPSCKKSKAVAVVVSLAIVVNTLITYLPTFNSLSSGWKIIITTVIASAIGAFIFPQGGEVVE